MSNRLPFDWKNPIGYLIAVAVQLQIHLIFFRYIACFFTLVCAQLMFVFSVVKDIKGELNRFNEIARTKKTQCRSMKQLSEIISIHISLKELSS